MGKLSTLSGREVRQILEAHGFTFVRQRGSHMVLQLKSGGSTVTVVVPDHTQLKTGTLRSIIRQCGLPRSLFEAD